MFGKGQQNYKIAYGHFDESLEEQAKKQGLKLKNAGKLEDIRRAIDLLNINGYINRKDKDRMIDKLHKTVMENMRQN